MIGTTIEITSDWSKVCKQPVCDDSPWYEDRYCGPMEYKCEHQAYDVVVTCTGANLSACPAGPIRVAAAHKGNRTEIVPTQLGDLQVDVVLRHVDGDEKQWSQSFVVRSPDNIHVVSSVPAAKPMVVLSMSFQGKVGTARTARVNGQPTRGPHVDLAALFPDRRDGDSGAVQPGTYELDIEVGKFRRTVTVDAK